MQHDISTCYGKWYKRIDECETCPKKYKNYCKDARNPHLITDETVNFDDVSYSADVASHKPEIDFDIPADTEKLIYSKKDLLELLSFMCSLDPQALDILEEKLRDADIGISQIAKRKRRSRQAIHQFIQRRCEEIPELEAILRNRKRKMNNIKQPTFQEAVCQIRKQTHEKKSKRQRNGLKSSKKLICLSQSLDLSRLSIFKGSKLIKNGSQV